MRQLERWPGDFNLLPHVCEALGKVGPAAAPAIPLLVKQLNFDHLAYYAGVALGGVVLAQWASPAKTPDKPR